MAVVHIIRPRRVTMRDDSLPHQIRLTFTGDSVQRIAVSCTCRMTRGNIAGPGPLEARERWDDPSEPLRIWARHVAEVTE